MRLSGSVCVNRSGRTWRGERCVEHTTFKGDRRSLHAGCSSIPSQANKRGHNAKTSLSSWERIPLLCYAGNDREFAPLGRDLETRHRAALESAGTVV